MAKPVLTVPNTLYLSLVTVDAQSEMPLYRQIYKGLRDAITSGRLAPGTKLPSTRDLAEIWKVSRNTLRNAFDQLIAEGYLEAIVGKGTFVAEEYNQLTVKRPPEVGSPDKPERIRPISVIGQHLEPFGRALRKPPAFTSNDFAIGIPDYDAFPHKIWNRIVNRAQRRLQTDDSGRYNPRGMLKLRQAIASYLTSARGVQCTPEQVDIVPGSSAGMLVATLALLNQGDTVWMENPGYLSATGLFQYRGAEPCFVPIDQHGLNIEYGIEHAPNAKIAYVTPSHQYPLGVTMTRERRHQLLDWAGQSNMWIFEDDYDSEFRYDSPPITALQGLDSHNRVIYFGTFSKIMLPGLHIAYVVLPPDLVDVYTGVKLPLSLRTSAVMQEAIAEFMLKGHFVRHIRTMRSHYSKRRDALKLALETYLKDEAYIGDVGGGMHIAVYFADEFDEPEVTQLAQEHGIAALSFSSFSQVPMQKKGIIFGFANVSPEKIDQTIKRFAAALKNKKSGSLS